MKIYNIFFSPTGTSEKIAGAVAREISSALNIAIDNVNVTTASHDDIVAGEDDIVVLAAPVYGGHMAPIAKSRMGMISGRGTNCILIAVYGNRAFEQALVDMSDFAGAHGLKPVAAGAFVGEHSYSTPLTPIAVGRPDDNDMKAAAEFGRRIAHAISGDPTRKVDVTAVRDIATPEQSLANFKEFVMDYSARQKSSPVRLVPEVDVDVCPRCGVCVTVCPTCAIADDCVTTDAAKCIKCCACVKHCPEEARSLHSPFAPVLSVNFSRRKEPVFIV